MKKIIPVIFLLLSFFNLKASSALSQYKGVWSSDSAEAVITDSICIFYFRADSTMQAILEIPSADILRQVTFFQDGTISVSSDLSPVTISESAGVLDIGGYQLRKIEDLRIVSPYTMPQCKSRADVGRCLQEWRLCAGYGIDDDMIYCEVNTNRHMFVYMVNPSMVYIRAAATRNNNNGTLFFQNIRMMKNRNTNEYTMHMEPRNFSISRDDLEIDNSRFQPDKCTFSPDGGIYWSLISFEPDRILLNGCGETYEVKRPEKTSDFEWFEYVPYAPEDAFPALH